LVEVRWVYYYVSGTGTRAQMALDDVSVNVTNLGTPSYTSTHDFSLYPNPTGKGIVYLTQAEDISVYDMLGTLVLAKKEATSFDTAGLPTGVYLVKAAGAATRKLIIE